LPDRHTGQELPPVVAFANDWATDPTSKHHLMRLLALRTPVLWIETTGMRRPTVTSAADWRRVVAKLRRMGGALRPGAPGLTVLSPPALPFPTSAIARRLNAWLYRRAVRRAMRQLGWRKPPVLWVYTPTAARYLDRLDARGLVYHCVDRWWAFDDYDSHEMRSCHEILCRRADRVFVSSLELQADCDQLAGAVDYVPHGVDWEHFHQAAVGGMPRPADLPQTGRPVIGFIGLIDTWIDLELLAEVARAHPEADLVLIGASRVPLDSLAEMANVRILGRKPFRELPGYLQSFAVALVPFVMNDLTRAVNPIKLREYLSAGVPVVTTALPELLPFRGEPGVDVADNAAAFVAAVGRRLATPTSHDARLALSDQMRSESWEGRLESMLEQLGWITPTTVTESR
jgi:glycosyltransferase involved in cell wall biosynthesis